MRAILAITGRTMRPTDMAAIHSDKVKRDAVRLRRLHAAELRLPGIKGGSADTMTAANLGRLRALDAYVDPARAGLR